MKFISSLGFVGFFLFLFNCSQSTESSEIDTSSIPTDTATIKIGRTKFRELCSSCHGFSVDAIGPQLGGLTHTIPTDWIREFVKDPKGKIESGDERAVEQFQKFKLQMPPFAFLKDEDLNAILAYMHTTKAPAWQATLDPNALKDPIPERIPMSKLVIELKEFVQIPPSGDQNPLTRITKLTHQPNTDKLFVVDLRGKLYYLNGNKPEVYFDIVKEKPKFIHTPGLATGFGSFAFHPEFAKNGLLYTSHTEPPNSATADFNFSDSIKVTLQWVLTEWKTQSPSAMPFTGAGRELLRVDVESQIHGMQELAFNPFAKPGDKDYGLLYFGIGDGGSAEHGHPEIC
jgi:mono/diheme cytochrome c family protein